MKTIKHVGVFLRLLHAALLRHYGRHTREFDVGLFTVAGIGAGCVIGARALADVSGNEFWLQMVWRLGLIGVLALSAAAVFLAVVGLPHAIKQGPPPWMLFLVDLWRQAGSLGERA